MYFHRVVACTLISSSHCIYVKMDLILYHYADTEEELEDDGVYDIDSEEQSKRDSYEDVMLDVSSEGDLQPLCVYVHVLSSFSYSTYLSTEIVNTIALLTPKGESAEDDPTEMLDKDDSSEGIPFSSQQICTCLQ